MKLEEQIVNVQSRNAKDIVIYRYPDFKFAFTINSPSESYSTGIKKANTKIIIAIKSEVITQKYTNNLRE